MRTEQEIKDKLGELDDELNELESDFNDHLEDEGIDEFSDQYEPLEDEFNFKKKEVEKRIELLEWILGE